MSSLQYQEVLALSRDLKENERVNLILDISKTMNEVLMKKNTKELSCPYFGSRRIVKNGKNKTTQRYLCKICSKSFISVTNTPIYYSRKEINIWSEYIHLLLQGYSLRETIKIIPISLKAAFLWRHKILDALRDNLKTKELCGKIQADETYFRESFKGNHSKDGFIMPRKSHRRGTMAKLRGISKMQVCVLTALDSNKNIVIEPSCMGRPGSSDFLRVLGSVIKKDSVLVTDSLFSYRTLSSYSKSKHIWIPTGSHSIGLYNIQKINNLHSKVKKFMAPYKGVSTKYLSNYMFLFKYIESKCEATPLFFSGTKPYFITNFKGAHQYSHSLYILSL
ncbi:MAG: IS1595 family transposase [Clostridium sp.]